MIYTHHSLPFELALVLKINFRQSIKIKSRKSENNPKLTYQLVTGVVAVDVAD